jgi:hypothetical protein
VKRLKLIRTLAWASMAAVLWGEYGSSGTFAADAQASRQPVILSAEHIAAVNRPRRVFPNADESLPPGWEGGPIGPFVAQRFAMFDKPGSQVTGVVWCFDEGNLAWYPSKVLPMTKSPAVKKWLDAGVDFVKAMVAETHKRKLECFWAYRVNGYDTEWDRQKNRSSFIQPMKAQHPDWLISGGAFFNNSHWNYAIPGVHDYKVAILRELAENYDFDGIDLDFTRGPPHLPIGQAWLHRDAMTDFIRRARQTFQEVARKRGRPLLLSVRVSETVPGCNYDGLDVETWARENLVDIFFLGSRSLDVDLAGFRRIVQGHNIKLIPSLDDYHTTDGYGRPTEGRHTPIEFYRGVYGNWWQQGADAVQTFNFHHTTPKDPNFQPQQQRAYHEIGDPKVMQFRDKMFVVQRRYGGDAPKTWNWYVHTNPQGALPAIVPADGLPSIQTLYVCDDLAAAGGRLKGVQLRLRLSGEPAPDAVEVKLNGVLLSAPKVGQLPAAQNWTGKAEDGWWMFQPPGKAFAVGQNLVSVCLRSAAAPSAKPVVIEKIEAHVRYHP